LHISWPDCGIDRDGDARQCSFMKDERQLMVIESIRRLVAELNVSAGALAALGAALDVRVSGVALAPELQPHVEDVIAALGVRAAIEEAVPSDLQPLLGEIRAFAMTNSKLLFAATRRSGWAHSEPDLLQAAGEVSTAFPRTLQRLMGHLPGLAERLELPCASFLDVGVGVGALSMEMARLWPALHILGIDRWTPALALAHRSVQAAGLAERIALREQSAEDLTEIEAFDLAWIPGVFVSEAALQKLIPRVRLALRPGGWLLLAVVCGGDDTLAAAVARLRTACFGGSVTTSEIIEQKLGQHGFVDVRTLSRAAGSLTAVVVARRPE
jgi:precorrin-6B methylase 2